MERRVRQDLLERRSEIFQLIISVILLGIAVGILSNVIFTRISGWVPILIALAIIASSILWLCNVFLGKPVVESISMTLLLNRESGMCIPLSYYPAQHASIMLSENSQILKPFSKNLPNIDNQLIRDLVESIMVNWLSTILMIGMSPSGQVILPPVIPPTSNTISLETTKVLSKFGENVFADIAKDKLTSNIVVPNNITVLAKRYESKTVNIEMAIGDRPIFREPIGGTLGRSELVLKGSRRIPLDYFVIRGVVTRVSSGEPLYLWLSGYTPVSISPDKIICKEDIFEGEALKEVQKWIEIDCSIIIGYKMRGYLFWHPSFAKWYRWAEDMISHAKLYFDFTPYLKRKCG